MKVAVIGAGVSGLTFAAAMRKAAPDVEIALFERDPSPTHRPQGYAIGLRNGTGLTALGELGLRDAVVGSDSIRVTNLAFTNQAGQTLLSLKSSPDDPNTTYRVQRLHLKQVLLEAAEPRRVQFGARCLGYVHANGRVIAAFEDKSQVDADYLIACDGAASAIRQQLVGDHKRYLGLVSIHAEAPIEVEHPLLDGGYFLTMGKNGCSFFCYRQPGGVYWSYVVHADSEASIADQPQDVLLQRVQSETRDWHDLVPRFVAAAKVDTIGVRGYYDKEPIKRVHEVRVWVIGDAAHPMCPFQGQGANMALVDAVRLARLLATPRDPQETEKVDADIAKRGRDAVLQSRSNARRFHETRAFARVQRDLAFRTASFFIGLFRSRT
jgi:salicylate hydroxylase